MTEERGTCSMIEKSRTCSMTENRGTLSTREKRQKRERNARISFVNPGKGLGDDCMTAQVAGLQGGMLSAATLTVVLIADDHPRL